MKPPIFVWEPNDLLAFGSVEATEGWIEWQDHDEGKVFDCEGRLLELFLVEDSPTPSVRVRPLEEQPAHQDELRTALLEAFAAVGEPRLDSAGLEELSKDALAKFLVR